MIDTLEKSADSVGESPTLATDTASNKALAYKTNYEMLVEHDMGSIDRYFGDYYVQHNARLRNGLVELRTYKSANVAHAQTQIVRCIGDRDLVFSQFRVSKLLPHDVVFFDIYRIEAGKVVEHWDAFQETEGPNAHGRTLFDGPTAIEHPELTEATRAVVTGLVSRVFVLEEFEALDLYVASDLREYTPNFSDGIEGLRKGFLQAQWFTGAIKYIALRRVIAEGEFAVTCSEGEIGGVPHALWDLWRVIDGKVVDHWGVRAEAQKSPHHNNPAV